MISLPQSLIIPCKKGVLLLSAYSNRTEPEMVGFFPYPAFRIPLYLKAVFTDGMDVNP